MSTQDLTIQVLGLSSGVTLGELNTFFSYCGTVEKIQLQRNKDLSQTALVTFVQPYAFQTALLLHGARFGSQPISILPAKDLANPPILDQLANESKKKKKMQGFIPGMQAIASKGIEMLNMTKEEVEENYKLSEKGRLLMEQTRSLVCAAEQAAGHIGTKIVSHDYISTTSNWLSSALDKASKHAADLGTRKRHNPNSRKQK